MDPTVVMLINYEMEEMCKKTGRGIPPQRLRKTTKNLSHVP
jgi:hypothetical protein